MSLYPSLRLAACSLLFALVASGQATETPPFVPADVIVCWGDSITHEGNQAADGWVHLLQAKVSASAAGATVVAYGQPGLKTSGFGCSETKAGNRLASQLPRRPTACVVSIGVNDVWHREKRFGAAGSTPQEYREALRLIVKHLQASGAVVVLATPAVLGERTDGKNDMTLCMTSMPAQESNLPSDALLDEYAAISREVAAASGAELCDLRAAFLAYLRTANPEQKSQGFLTRDGCHPTPAGHKLIADEIGAALVRALSRPASALYSAVPVSTMSPGRARAGLRPGTAAGLQVVWSLDEGKTTTPLAANGIIDLPGAKLPGLRHQLTISAMQGGTIVASQRREVRVIDALPAQSRPADALPGLAAIFHLAAGAAAPEIAIADPTESAAFPDGVMAVGDTLAIRGWVEVPVDGLYALGCQAWQGRYTLEIDGQRVVEQTGPAWTVDIPCPLAAGFHAIAIDFAVTTAARKLVKGQALFNLHLYQGAWDADKTYPKLGWWRTNQAGKALNR